MDLDKQGDLKLINVVPECYSHILGNPEFIKKQMEEEMNEREYEDQAQRLTDIKDVIK